MALKAATEAVPAPIIRYGTCSGTDGAAAENLPGILWKEVTLFIKIWVRLIAWGLWIMGNSNKKGVYSNNKVSHI